MPYMLVCEGSRDRDRDRDRGSNSFQLFSGLLNGYILCSPALEGLTACHTCWYVKAVAIEIATETEAQTVFNCFQVLRVELQSWAT